ncbi:tetratricopeptide repeat protein [Thermodesulfatator autotrophicus]|uniref:Uncharacterized protein n=1 Tax=Thermodesulfatator autotrophicus TaxID=1795632 RepID=A0A177EAS5_9BACT|nr:hypothetical protein [Thermodesulfatator autotrophicus]OAG28621.1 hypothetical protein TH606_00540 [Thermodesulfatator autotrophicus]
MSKLFESIKKLEEKKTEFSIKGNYSIKKEKRIKRNKFYIYIILSSFLIGCLTLVAFFIFKAKFYQGTEIKNIKTAFPKTAKNSIDNNQKPQKLTKKEKKNHTLIQTKRETKTNIQKENKKENKMISEPKKSKLNHYTTKKNKKHITRKENNKIEKISISELSTKKHILNRYIMFAEEARKNKNYEIAIFYYQKALSETNEKTKKAEILNNLGAIYLLENKINLAQTALEKAIKFSASPEIVYNLTIIYLKQQKIDKACSIIKRNKNKALPELISIQKKFCSKN